MISYKISEVSQLIGVSEVKVEQILDTRPVPGVYRGFPEDREWFLQPVSIRYLFSLNNNHIEVSNSESDIAQKLESIELQLSSLHKNVNDLFEDEQKDDLIRRHRDQALFMIALGVATIGELIVKHLQIHVIFAWIAFTFIVGFLGFFGRELMKAIKEIIGT